jgi:Concanavalin A-like lectin/glucanases superfamily
MGSNYTNTVLAEASLIAYYPLDELSGLTAKDRSGNGYDGTLHGAVTVAQPGLTKGDSSTSMSFDGSSGYISCPTTGLPSGASPFTLECVVRMPTLPSAHSYNMFLSFGDYSSHAKASLGFYQPTSTFTLDVYGDGLGTFVAAPNTTYYVAATYDGVNCRLFVGTPYTFAQTDIKAESLSIVKTFCTIGAGNNGPGDQYPGLASRCAFYSTALSFAHLQARWQASITPVVYSPQDAFVNKFQIVKCYDSSGNFIDVIRDAPYLAGFKEQINAAADAVRVVLPRRIDAYDGQYQPGSRQTLTKGNVLQWWLYGAGLPAAGMLRYNGVIDTITPKGDESGGESVEVLVTPYSQVLGDHAITSTLGFGTAGTSSTYIDTGQMFQSLFTGSYINSSGIVTSTLDPITSQPYGAPYTMAPMSTAYTGQKVQFAYQNQDLLSTVSTILLLSPANYFVRMNQDKTTFLGQLPGIPTYTLMLGQHITSLEYSDDNVPRKNVIYIQGKGSVHATATGSSVSSIGERVYFKSDNRITDNNTAQLLANGILALYDRPQVRAKVKIPDYRGDMQPGLGFDIEKFKVGQTVKIVDAKAPPASINGIGGTWGQMVWGSGKWGPPSNATAVWGAFNWGAASWGTSFGPAFNASVPIMAINYNYHYVELELGWRQAALNRKLYALESAFNDATLVS